MREMPEMHHKSDSEYLPDLRRTHFRRWYPERENGKYNVPTQIPVRKKHRASRYKLPRCSLSFPSHPRYNASLPVKRYADSLYSSGERRHRSKHP